jgi:hypothetical protein
MALLPNLVKDEIRQHCAKEAPLVGYTKEAINNGIQAIEDWFETNRASLNTAINTATSPVIMSAQTRRHMVMAWLKYKMGVV